MFINNKIESIDCKTQSLYLLKQGLLGNTLRIWDSYEEILKDKYIGNVSIRHGKEINTRFYKYNINVNEVPRLLKGWKRQGLHIGDLRFNEAAPDHLLLIQGAVTESTELILDYSTKKRVMQKDAMEHPTCAVGLTAQIILQHFLDPSSYEDMRTLLYNFPDHVVEFSTFNCCLGFILGRNTVFWEVRRY
jgi:hypothetical protein